MIPRSQLVNLPTLQLDLNSETDGFFFLIMVDKISRAGIPVVGGSLFRFSTGVDFTVHRHGLKQNGDPKSSNAFVFNRDVLLTSQLPVSTGQSLDVSVLFFFLL